MPPRNIIVHTENLSAIIQQAVDAALKAGANDPRVEELIKITKTLNEIVSGNGHPENGLVLKVDRLSTSVQELKDNKKEQNTRNFAIIMLVLGNIVSLAFNFLGAK